MGIRQRESRSGSWHCKQFRKNICSGALNYSSLRLCAFEAGVVLKVLEFGLVTAIVLAVGGFGGTEPITWGIAQALIVLLGLLLVLSPPKRASRKSGQLLWIPTALVAWVAAQWLGSRYGAIGSDTHAIETQGLALITSIIAFYVALEVARKRGSGKRLALCLIAVGLLEAAFGLAQYLTGWQQIWNVRRRFYIGSATGTYINHNHFAGLLEMIFPLVLGLALYHAQKALHHSRHSSVRDFLHKLGHPEMLKGVLLLLVGTVLFLATVFSLSRMGMISMVASLGVMGAALSTGRNRSLLAAALTLILVAGGVAASMWVGVTPVVEHFEQLPRNEAPDQSSEGRFALWGDTLKLIGEHPWTGVGLGCFEVAFTKVQSVQLTYVADHAHNDYLELAAELGLPAAAFLFSLLFWLAGRILRASRRARSSLIRALALGSLGGTSALLVHSAADFNLYVPANGLIFAVLLGMGYAMSFEESAGDGVLSLRSAGELSLRRAIPARSGKTHDEDKVEAGVSGPRSS
jgi:O-antigen ligase